MGETLTEMASARLFRRTATAACAAYFGTRIHCLSDDPEPTVITNWSGTHDVSTRWYREPESIQELVQIVKAAHDQRRQIRPVGSALSPNGIGFSEEGMINMVQCDEVVKVDVEKQQVTVLAGARVSQVVAALRPHNLTLQNYASIAEQQVGGFIQVGAHGTGATVPPVDQTVVSFKLVTPARGMIELSSDQEPELFAMARVGLGALGVLAEVTLQCVPAHRLEEGVYTATAAEIRRDRETLLQNQHMRLMWIPHTDTVVVVCCNPTTSPVTPSSAQAGKALGALRLLLTERQPQLADLELCAMNFAQLRDELLAADPLDPHWVARVNRAEAEFWKGSTGSRVNWSDQVLGFECGGEQWVWENAFEVPEGTTVDIDFMEELLADIKKKNLPAPSPIEQRWTAGSSACMSTAPGSPKSLHSWVGVIMYLPTEEEAQRKAITSSFQDYCRNTTAPLLSKYKGKTHWAKLEKPRSAEELEKVRAKLCAVYPVEQFNKARKQLDPHNIMSNEMLNDFFGKPQ